MRTSTPLWLLGALGALTLTVADPVAAADPSQWTCESCPFEKPNRQGTVDVGVGHVSHESARLADYTGLQRDGVFGIAAATLRHRYSDGGYADVNAQDLGLDSRALAASTGRSGTWGLRLGYAEIPHVLSDTAATPFLGAGTASLTLPPGFTPGATTADMPLASTLQPLDIGTKRKRADIGATLAGPVGWSWRVDARHDEKKGTLRGAGSFFSTTSQLPLPVDQVTDQVEVSASYSDPRWSASLAYHASSFRNRDDALTWQNPFAAPPGSGATLGQLALPPDNQFHQVRAAAGYQFTPQLRASADVAVGRMQQDQAFLPATVNPTLGTVALPAGSLQGRADTLDASVRLSMAATETLRLAASVTRNERDNRTPALAVPVVSTDLFVGTGTRTSQPYSVTRDRVRLSGDWRGPKTVTVAAGVDHDTVERTLQEVDRTRENTVWARATARPLESVSVALKVAHAERSSSDYKVLATIQPPENPLLRKYNLADRDRNAIGLRADATVGEGVALGVSLDASIDDYTNSPLGLTDARNASLGADLSFAITEQTQLRAYAMSERSRSTQLGSQQFGAADWRGRVRDETQVVGVGVTHSALKGKLELGGDLTVSRTRSRTLVQTGASAGSYPAQKAAFDSLKLTAQWRLRDDLSVLGGWSWERWEAQDWRWDGVLPATVPTLLAFGESAPNERVSVVRVALRYKF